MTERQFEGRSAAEAAIKACETLGLTRSELVYKVISETGELLSRRVVIAVDAPVAVKAEAPVAPAARKVETASVPKAAAAEQPVPKTTQRRASGPAPRAQQHEQQQDKTSGHTPQPRRSPTPADGIDSLLRLDTLATQDFPERPEIAAQTPRAKRALAVVGDLVRLMEIPHLRVCLVAEEDAEVHIDIRGDDANRVIGKKGEILLALQFVVNRIINRSEEEGEGNQMVILDAGSFREKRRFAMQDLAKRLATRALEESKAVRLSAMSSHDRRVFHLALKEFAGITTRSEGDGLYRHLLIIPSELC